MAVEECGEQCRAAILGDRDEEAQAPGDDLGGETRAPSVGNHAVGEAGQLDAMCGHDQ